MDIDRLLSLKASHIVFPIVLMVIVFVFAYEFTTYETTLEILGFNDVEEDGPDTGPELLELSLPLFSEYISEGTSSERMIEQAGIKTLMEHRVFCRQAKPRGRPVGGRSPVIQAVKGFA